MGKTNRRKKGQGAQRNEMLKAHPEQIVKNPALQYSGTETANMALRDPGHTPGGARAETRDGVHKVPLDEMDQTRSGAPRNQSEEFQNASHQFKHKTNVAHKSSPSKKYGGKEGKTMVKNRGYDKD